jgi:BlaR1 peptidase M56/parvulin-like peptidyl-prolyl cis-trans isomerase-like protein
VGFRPQATPNEHRIPEWSHHRKENEMNSSLLTSRLNEVIFLAPAVEAFGWTLLHFVWQGTLVALAFGCFLAFSQGTSPRVRYLVGCAALSLMALSAISTFLWQVGTRDVRTARQSIASPIVALIPGGRGNSLGAHEPIGHDLVLNRPLFVGHNSALESQPTRDISTRIEPLVLPSGARFVSLTTEGEPSPDPLRPWLDRLVGVWVIGVVLLSVRLAVGWRVICRLRAQGQSKKDSVWCTRFACLKERIGVSSSVQLLWSASASVPMVIGWARPVVLVPTALLTGLSASQLEAVLAHELAHIRRHDYLVNLLQNVLETLLFYHPAVWWISEQVRNEREHCCDDLAAAACGGTLNYARALTALAELRHTSGSLGLAATGGSLVARIARLAGFRSPGPRVGWPLTALVLLGGAVAAFLATHRAGLSDDAHVPAAARGRSTFSLAGRVLDPWGKPVAQANVWVAASDGKGHAFDGLPIVGHGTTSADGRFDLAVDKSVLEGFTASEGARCEVWVRKPGLALACHIERDGFPHRPLEIQLRPQDAVSLRLHNPDGSPCAAANVFPTAAKYGDERFIAIPEVVRQELKVQSAADGRVEIVGMSGGQIDDLCFATADFGVQSCRLPAAEWPNSEPADITLRKTGTLQGRLVPPAGLKPALARAKLRVLTGFSSPQKGSMQWTDELTIQPDSDGKFTVPKIAEGTVRIFVDLPEDCNCRSDGFGLRNDPSHEALMIVPGRTSTVEIPMWQGVRVKRLVRDARTKKPLSGISVMLRGRGWTKTETDKNGIFVAWIHPDTAYKMDLDLPRGYVRQSDTSLNPVPLSSATAERELPPVELIPGRRIEGEVVDPSGQPFGRVRIHADCRVYGVGPAGAPVKFSKQDRWTTTDSQGSFYFDGLNPGAQITLTPVRAEIVLADPFRVEPGNDKPVRLQTRQFEFAPIEGCVVDRGGYPVAGVEVAVQLLRPNATVDALRLRTDTFGRFKTRAYFPKQTEYRVAVRARSKEIASSAPHRVAESNGPLPDLVIDRPAASERSKLDGTEPVANVNGEPILASEVIERAYSTPLGPNQISLRSAAEDLKAGNLREDEYRELQEIAVRTYLKDFVKTRLLSQALLESLDKEQTRQAESAISKMFEEYVGKLKIDLRVSSQEQVAAKLERQGQSLDHLRQEFRRRILADEYLRKQQKTFAISRDARQAYYDKHLDDYRHPEKVRWQLLEIRFERYGDRQQARSAAEQAQAELRHGESFASVVRKYCDAPRVEQEAGFSRRTVAGPLPRPSADWWTTLNSSNDQELTDAMHQIAAGEDVKQVFNRPEWGHVELAQQSDSPARLDNTTKVPATSAGVSEARSVQLQRTPSRYRRVRLHSRYAREFNIFNRPVPNGMPREQVTIVTGGANLLLEGLDQRVGGKRVGTIDLSADRMVIWSQGGFDDAINWAGGLVQAAEEPLEVYLEGNVVIHQKDPHNPQLRRMVHAEAATFDALEKRSLLLDAQLEAYLSSKKGSVRFWADRMRQLGPHPFPGKDVLTMASQLAKAGDRIQRTSAVSAPRFKFEKVGADAATDVPARGAENLRHREASDQAARNDFDADGGTQSWTNPASLADPRLSAVLETLTPGETSAVLESVDAFRIVQLMEKRPASCKPFDEVEPSIRQMLEEQQQQQILDELHRRATIESPYLPESQTRSPKKSEPTSSMSDPPINLVPLDSFAGLMLSVDRVAGTRPVSRRSVTAYKMTV